MAINFVVVIFSALPEVNNNPNHSLMKNIIVKTCGAFMN